MLIIEEILTEEYWRCVDTIQAITEQLAELPKGTIQKRTRGNREYYYLKYRDGNKVVSKYVKQEDVDDIAEKLEYRKSLLRIIENEKATRKVAVRGLGKVPDSRIQRQHI